MDNIACAPVVIPTLCRHEHFKKGIESLKKNPWAKYTDVYIALDYPAKDEHWDGYNKICEYLDKGDFTVFKSFNVVKREKNLGPGFNTADILEGIIKKYDRWIMAEDDIVFSPAFLEYMDKCLEMYKDDENIIAVNGYSYPLDWKVDKGANTFFQSLQCSTWGIGFWREKYLSIKSEIMSGYLVKNFDMSRRTGLLKKMAKSERYTYIFESLIGRENSIILASSDNAYGIYMTLRNKCIVMPIVSKTRNMGFDGSGLTCPDVKQTGKFHSLSYDYSNQPIDMSDSFDSVPDSVIGRIENNKILDEFWRMPPSYILVTKIAMALYRLLGINAYKKIMGKFFSLICAVIEKHNAESKYIKYFRNVTFSYLEKYRGN